MQLDDRPIDADNHYYETLDAFTRHQDPKMKRRGVQVMRDGKRVQIVIADKVNRFIPIPTFDPVIVPGCIDLVFRGKVPAGVDAATLAEVVVHVVIAELIQRELLVADLDVEALRRVVPIGHHGAAAPADRAVAATAAQDLLGRREREANCTAVT